MGSDRRIDHMLRIAISGGGQLKFSNNKKTVRSKPQMDLTSAPPINLPGNASKQPKSRQHRNHQVRTSKSDSFPTTNKHGISTRPNNSAPETRKTAANIPKENEKRENFPKMNTFVQENVYGLTTAQLAFRDMPNGKNWARQLAGLQQSNKYLRAEGSKDKLILRKHKPEKSNLKIIPQTQTPETDHGQKIDKYEAHKTFPKLDVSKITAKTDSGQTVKKTLNESTETSRSTVRTYDHLLRKRVRTRLAARRLAWTTFRRKNKHKAQILSQNNVKTEKQLNGVYANNNYKMQRQARVLKKVEDVQYNKVQDINEEITKREMMRNHSILAQREHLKLLRDKFDAEQVKRFKNQYVSWKSVETDRLARSSEAYGLPENIYVDRYSKELQPVAAKIPAKKTFKLMATRVRNIQRFRLILNPKTTSDPDKVLKVSDKLLVEGIDTVQLPSTDGDQQKRKKPIKIRAVIGSAKRLISSNTIDAINELSEGEWDDLSSLDISDTEELDKK
ncbi:uncharacterized protein [Antedon mediterranea]|uniref:uncharacterized protein isoform X2 n=1 Tax=Antedon mediterranea TaxID=105859 RepID=UPI003AF5FAE5